MTEPAESDAIAAAAAAFLASSRTPELASTIHAALRRQGVLGEAMAIRHLRALLSASPRFARHGKHLWKLAGRDYGPLAKGATVAETTIEWTARSRN